MPTTGPDVGAFDHVNVGRLLVTLVLLPGASSAGAPMMTGVKTLKLTGDENPLEFAPS